MKTRFTTLDICSVITEINESAVGLRLNNVYDIDNKTYLLKLIKPDVKKFLLIESGIRMHLSEFDWPKNNFPSGFAMKLRKHIRGKRLTSVNQLGIDRIIDLQFGSGEMACHMIVELYDRGNIALTDCNYTILNLLRYRRPTAVKENKDQDENSDVRIAVHEEYPISAARPQQPLMSLQEFVEVLSKAKEDSQVKRVLNSRLPYGISTIEHCLCIAGFSTNVKTGKSFSLDKDAQTLHTAFQNGENLLRNAQSTVSKGYIIQKKEKKATDGSEMITNVEFQPFLFEQHKNLPHTEYNSFNKAVDEFYGAMQSQKNDLKQLQREKQAMKKLENVRKDHESRINGLRVEQEEDCMKAELIEANLADVDKAIRVICGAIANQLDWADIESLVRDAQANEDPVALKIRKLKLDTNSFMMSLSMPYYDSPSSDESDESSSSIEEKSAEKHKMKPYKIEIDLSLTAYGNAEKYYSKKRLAKNKEQRTIDASEKAFKSAQKKTKETLKEVETIHTIQKSRKVYWFEKFVWFISTENYLVIGGHDAQQNEILVKRYLRAGDVYVHADLHGATSCIIKNNNPSQPIPPSTLNEAGTMAICHSGAWDAKVVTSAWWVHHDQVSKTAPSGEYLTTGSFLIRGKKNYLPPSYLVYGFGFLFKVDESCIWKHKDERKVKVIENNESRRSDFEKLKISCEDEKSEKSSNEDEKCVDEDSNVDEKKDAIEDVESKSDSNDDTVKAEFEFPNSEIKIDYKGEEKIQNQKVRLSAKQKRDLRKQKKKNQENEQPSNITDSVKTQGENIKQQKSQPQVQLKRGQKNKLRKMKNKYKDQDEEDRELAMKLLASGGESKKNKENNKKGKNNVPSKGKNFLNEQKDAKKTQKDTKRSDQSNDNTKHAPTAKTELSDDEEMKQEEPQYEGEQLLQSLTGCPQPDDIILFAIPTCAPYSSMKNYKFKVKLTPGNNKKGKATKTALQMFQMTKETTQQEKDHLRSVKDYDMSKNIPGKVKLSAPNLQGMKQKQKQNKKKK